MCLHWTCSVSQCIPLTLETGKPPALGLGWPIPALPSRSLSLRQRFSFLFFWSFVAMKYCSWPSQPYKETVAAAMSFLLIRWTRGRILEAKALYNVWTKDSRPDRSTLLLFFLSITQSSYPSAKILFEAKLQAEILMVLIFQMD